RKDRNACAMPSPYSACTSLQSVLCCCSSGTQRSGTIKLIQPPHREHVQCTSGRAVDNFDLWMQRAPAPHLPAVIGPTLRRRVAASVGVGSEEVAAVEVESEQQHPCGLEHLHSDVDPQHPGVAVRPHALAAVPLESGDGLRAELPPGELPRLRMLLPPPPVVRHQCLCPG